MNTKYKIVFIDIDGTLVDDEKYISNETIEVLRRLKESGVHIVLTSGRAYKSVEAFAEKCFATPYLIGSGGAIIKDFENDIEIYSKKLEKDVAAQVLNCVKKHNLYTIVTISGNLVSDKREYGLIPENRSEIMIVDSIMDYLKETSEPILNFAVINQDKTKLELFKDDVIKILDLYVLPIDVILIPPRFWQPREGELVPYVVDISSINVSKRRAIEVLCEYLGVEQGQTVGVGDGLNDIDMFEGVGYKIAMGNAAKEIKNMADMITTSNNESGAARALNKLFFS
jgi:Cof subfamily protein (haloacid dehalogenase superfamily)